MVSFFLGRNGSRRRAHHLAKAAAAILETSNAETPSFQ